MPTVDLDRDLCELAATRPKVASTESKRTPLSKVRALLEDEAASAMGCFLALKRALGDQCRAWEPESLWLTLSRGGVDVPAVNRDKILAAHTLTMVPAFWWEVNCYQNTVLAFNGVISDPDVAQETTPAQMAWGVFEAEMIYGYSDLPDAPDFDREPALYTAICLHRAGYLLAPELLSFAQEALDKLNNAGGLKVSEVRAAWRKVQKTDLASHAWKDDNPLDVQLARLASVVLYVKDKSERYKQDISSTV